MAKAYPRLPPLSAQQIARFWSHVDKTPGQGPHGDCWEWTAFRWETGYGGVTLCDTSFRAHRVAFYIHSGYDPGHLIVRHMCHNKPCCNPSHLKDGTSRDNSQDSLLAGLVSRGKKHGDAIRPNAARGDRNGARLHPETRARGDRHGSRTHPERLPRGAASPKSKFESDEIPRRIRKEYRDGAIQTALAAKYHVDQSTISDLVRFKTYRHLLCLDCGKALCDCPRAPVKACRTRSD